MYRVGHGCNYCTPPIKQHIHSDDNIIIFLPRYNVSGTVVKNFLAMRFGILEVLAMRQLSQFKRHQVSDENGWILSKGSVRQRLVRRRGQRDDTGLTGVKREPPDRIATKWSAGQAFISTPSENQQKTKRPIHDDDSTSA